MKYEFFDSKDLIELYDLIEEVCGEKAFKYYNCCRRRKINSITQLVKLFAYQDEESVRQFFKGTYCGEVGISILKECVNYQIDAIPF